MAPKSPEKASDVDEQRAKRAKIMEIQRDATLTEAQKTQQIQGLHATASKWLAPAAAEKDPLEGLAREERESVTCGICMDIVTRPVTLPCQHNMCLGCLQGIRKMETCMRKCPYCRKEVLAAFIDSARINMTIVTYVRNLRAKCAGKTEVVAARIHRETRACEERPEEAFVTDRAKRKGMANACSGSLKMSCPPDHFGPIGPEYDPKRSRGLVVGDMFPNRMACRMWNAHLPHVAGIAGQGDRGAQSVVLSGGYEDDVDEGEYFLYTGSGGKDLSGNKRNGAHDKDQEFTRYNLALLKSCEEGLPVRVIRSHKEKRSAYAPKIESIEDMEEEGEEGEEDEEEGGEEVAKSKAKEQKGAKGQTGDKDKKGSKGKGKEAKKAGAGGSSGGKGKGKTQGRKGGKAAGKEKEKDGSDEEEEEEEEEDSAAGDSSEEGGEEEQEEEEAEEGRKAGGGGGGSSSRQVAEAKAHNPVRYDGIYRVLACWRGKGAANYLVCRYLFVRCDNSPAPWSSDDGGDLPRLEFPKRAAEEISRAKKLGEEVTYMTKTPFWDYNPDTKEWGWAKPPPVARAPGAARAPKQEKSLEKQLEAVQRDLKRMTKQLMESYGCTLCHQVATRPVYTPCTHMFCMDCLKNKLEGGDGQARHNARPSRSSSQRKPCPARGCGKDLLAFMRDVQTNNTMAGQAATAEEGVRLKEAEVAALQRKVEGREEAPAEEAEKTGAPAAADADAVASTKQQQQQEKEKEKAGAAAASHMTAAAAPKAEAASVAAAAATKDDVDDEMTDAAAAARQGQVAVAEAEGEQRGGSGASAGGSDSGGRWQAAATTLALRHPEFDVALISGLLEDQGGDEAEVDVYLARMKRDQRRANKSPRAEGAGGKRGRKKGGAKGGKAKAAAAAAEEEEAEASGGAGADGDKDGELEEAREGTEEAMETEAAPGGEGKEEAEVQGGKGKAKAKRAATMGAKAATAKEKGEGAKVKAAAAKADAAKPAATKRRKVAA
ncbi:hypothetical protein PLESTB_000789700 [Pleodorina starrii]|uniref:RING-type E3 ubiquitin transferase n=1 Tax=Pleodorina starrii TaxID=330485 RepID=A0A9W6BLX7_9CHLO|nr:hypothetical protein PLESTM_000495200 [Pleodorina starrii]GLC53811.1 hypothetical protein PLESTB_000789700 [Pleodorina starrii]GLC72991.1 hypothetical protein PLESTF_001317300 [Pleodorina starrii]